MRTRLTVVGTLTSAVAVGIAGAVAPVAGQAPAAGGESAGEERVESRGRRQRCRGAIRTYRGPGRPTTCAAFRRSGRTSSPAGRSCPTRNSPSGSHANNQTRTRELNRVGAFRNDVGTRTFRQTSLVVEPADGRIPPMTPEAQARGAAVAAVRRSAPSSWLDRSFYDRCITRGVLGSIMPVIYGNGNMIFQAPGYVTITYEMVHDTRIIPLDGRPHVGKNIRQYLGDARGHWEGNTLVVETTNFLGNTTGVGGNGGGTGTSEALRLTERFTRVAPDVLNYEATIDSRACSERFRAVITWAKMISPPMTPSVLRHGRISHSSQSILPSARGNGSSSRRSTAPASTRR